MMLIDDQNSAINRELHAGLVEAAARQGLLDAIRGGYDVPEDELQVYKAKYRDYVDAVMLCVTTLPCFNGNRIQIRRRQSTGGWPMR